MNTEVKEVEKFFNGYAYKFDSIYGSEDTNRNAVSKWIDRNFRKVMRLRFEETLKRSNSDSINSIIDVGCGGGQYCMAFLMQNKQVCALDVAETMLDIAKERTKNLENASNISFVHSDYQSYKATQNFDAAVFMGFFDYIEKPEIVLEKAIRETNKEIYASFPKDGGFLAAQRKVRYNLRNCPLWLYTKNDVETLLKKVGKFEQSEILDLGRGFFVCIKCD